MIKVNLVFHKISFIGVNQILLMYVFHYHFYEDTRYMYAIAIFKGGFRKKKTGLTKD